MFDAIRKKLHIQLKAGLLQDEKLYLSILSGKNPMPFFEKTTGEHSLLYKIVNIALARFPALTKINQDALSQCLLDYATAKYVYVLRETFSALDNPDTFLDNILKNLTACSIDDLTPVLNTFHQTHLAPIDTRIISPHRESNVRLRRFDAMARLFSIRPAHSVCSAVTIYNGELIIGANAKEEAHEELVRLAIKKSLDDLRTVVKDMNAKFKRNALSRAEDDTEFKAALKIHTQQVIEPHGLSVPVETFEQALYKFVDSMLFDDLIFTPEEKILFMTHECVILTPEFLRRHSEYAMKDIQYFHAEQLVVAYINNPKATITLGISKLSCTDCHNNLSLLPGVMYSGTHGQAYRGTVSVDVRPQANDAVAAGPKTPPRKPLAARTYVLTAHDSPGDTPQRRREKRERLDCGNTPPDTRRSLFAGFNSAFFLDAMNAMTNETPDKPSGAPKPP
jgi:hypothetical protein